MNVWLSIALGGALTFAIRYSFIGVLGHRAVPPWAAEALRLVPVAALSALVAADLAAPQPTVTLMGARLAAAAVAVAIAWKTRSVGWAVLGGMGVFFGWQAAA